jgi:predicted TIM-barrel fold metal-dependent hydrolase
VNPAAPSLDWLISVDDHVLEPPNVWQDRVPARYRGVAPRMTEVNGADVWVYEDKVQPTSGLSAAAGKTKQEFSPEPLSYRDMRPGCYDSVARLADMDTAGILASLCFPSFPRFCGQVFKEADDKELALLCVEAYNDWMIDEWCGSAPGRYIPLVIIPMWDPLAAAREIERCAARGARAFAFSENPEPLGLPTIHDPGRYWDPVFAAAQDTGLVVCMHVGSSSTMPSICSDAPALASLTWGAVRTAGTLLSWLFSDYFERMPSLKIALSEGNIGWIPYFLERGEQVVDRQRYWAAKSTFKPYDDGKPAGVGASLDTLDVRRTFREHVYGCFIEDASGVHNLQFIGEDNVMLETDYPHTDSTWPRSLEVAHEQLGELPVETQYKIMRGNAERLFRFTPADPPKRSADLR